MPIDAPYGSWPSPITASLITGTQVGLASPWLDGDALYWTESRPLEGGRATLLRRAADGTIDELTPAPFNLRTRVHEYGGRAFAASDGVVVGVEFKDQRIYRLVQGAAPVPLTPDSGGLVRYADLVVDLRHGRILAVREDHRAGGEPENALVAVPIDGPPHESTSSRADTTSWLIPGPARMACSWPG